jgi:hypothetical protein
MNVLIKHLANAGATEPLEDLMRTINTLKVLIQVSGK